LQGLSGDGTRHGLRQKIVNCRDRSCAQQPFYS
jgi:hypothetical protein